MQGPSPPPTRPCTPPSTRRKLRQLLGARIRRAAAQCGLPRSCGGGVERSETEGVTQASCALALPPQVTRRRRSASGERGRQNRRRRTRRGHIAILAHAPCLTHLSQIRRRRRRRVFSPPPGLRGRPLAKRGGGGPPTTIHPQPHIPKEGLQGETSPAQAFTATETSWPPSPSPASS
jgi:hypothetical protein